MSNHNGIFKSIAISSFLLLIISPVHSLAIEPNAIFGSIPVGWFRLPINSNTIQLVASPVLNDSGSPIYGPRSILLWNNEKQSYQAYRLENGAWHSELNDEKFAWKYGSSIWVSKNDNPIYLAGRLAIDSIITINVPPGLSSFGLPTLSSTSPSCIECEFIDVEGNSISELHPFMGYWVLNNGLTAIETKLSNDINLPYHIDPSIDVGISINNHALISIGNKSSEEKVVDILTTEWKTFSDRSTPCMWSILVSDVAIRSSATTIKFVDYTSNSDGKIYAIVSSAADSDDDGLPDNREIMVWGSDPQNRDSDGDGLLDGQEVANGLNPLTNDGNDDSDGDGVGNSIELSRGTDPFDQSSASIHWYVDSGRGSDLITDIPKQESPLKTIGAALANAIAGDVIHIADGIYYESIDDAGRGVYWSFNNISILNPKEELRDEK